jgi:hypothetical protein
MQRLHLERPATLRLAALALLASLATACISPAKQEVFKDGGIDIFLRSDRRWFTTIEKEYGHPVTIAPVRIAHILSRLDLRPPKGLILSIEDDKDRVAAIQTDMLYSMGEGISKALEAATPDQEIVVMAIRDTKRFGVFDHDYLTSFVTYVRDERLYIHLSRFEWEIPKRRDDRLPEPRVGDSPQRFKLYPGTAISLVDAQAVAVDWRDEVFARPTRTRILPGGNVVRREILLESPAEVDDIEDPVRRMPDDLSPQQLRELADVEEDRREGRITETEYRIRRRKILEPEA